MLEKLARSPDLAPFVGLVEPLAAHDRERRSDLIRTLGRAHYELREDAEARRVFEKGREVAQENGDLQTVKEIDVFLRRLEKRERGE